LILHGSTLSGGIISSYFVSITYIIAKKILKCNCFAYICYKLTWKKEGAMDERKKLQQRIISLTAVFLAVVSLFWLRRETAAYATMGRAESGPRPVCVVLDAGHGSGKLRRMPAYLDFVPLIC